MMKKVSLAVVLFFVAAVLWAGPAASKGGAPERAQHEAAEVANAAGESNIVQATEEAVERLSREPGQLKGIAWRGLAVLVAGAVAIVVIRRLSRDLKTKHHSLTRRLLLAMAEPMVYFVMVAALFGFMLPWLRSISWIYPWDARLFLVVETLILTWGGFKLIAIFDSRLRSFASHPDNNLDELMVDIIRKVLKCALVVVALLFIGQSIFNLNITALLAGAGVFGMAIAFASRETLSNFFGTLVIILDRPFRCGDRIQVAGVDGIVSSVGMRSTRILTGRESCVSIPNSTVAGANIENISLRGLIRYMTTLPLVYSTSAEKVQEAMAILHQIADDFHGPDQEQYRPRVFFHSFGESSLDICLIMWLKTDDFAVEESMRTEINCEILRRFGAAGIEFAYNTTTNILTGEISLKKETANQ